jgi:hypothetical protein
MTPIRCPHERGVPVIVSTVNRHSLARGMRVGIKAGLVPDEVVSHQQLIVLNSVVEAVVTPNIAPLPVGTL